MANVADTEGKAVKNVPVPTTEKSGGSEKYVFGALILGIVALLAYQYLFCPTCYM